MKKNFFLALALSMLVYPAFLHSAGRGASRNNLPSELRYGFSSEPVTFDPLNPASTADGRSILFNVFEGLVKPDSNGSLVPALADSYRIEDNGRLYVFTMRQGIMFHDDSPVTSADAVFSLNTAAEARFAGFENVEKIETGNSGEIRITLKEPDPEFLPYLTVGIVPERNTDRERNPIGTGPFKIKSYAPQENLRLEKNDNYWQAGLPQLDSVTIVFVPNNDALLTGIVGGNIHGATITGSMLSQLTLRNFDVIPWNSNTVQLLALNNAREPLNDQRVRLAINYAVDIGGIIDTAFFGHGEPSGSPVIPGLGNAYNESLRNPYPRDIARAKTLLSEAGFPQGFPLEIAVPSNLTMHVDTAQVIAEQLSLVGINATIRLVDWGTWLSEVYVGRKYQATIVSLDGANVSPRSFLGRYQTGHNRNFINFSSADFDRVYGASLVEPDEEKRFSLYRESQRIISENAASVFIQDITGFRAFRSGLFGGVVNYPLFVIDFSTIYMR